MPVVFKCSCGSYLSVSRKNIGKKVACPECEEVQVIPNPKQTRSIKLTGEESRRLRHGDVDDVKSAARERTRGAEEAKPKKKKEKQTLDVPEDSGYQSAILEAEGISINCFCGAQFSVSSDKAGETVDCESCGRSVSIPDPNKVEEIELAPLGDDEEKCPYCGVSVTGSQMKCHSCGKGLAQSRRFDAS